MKVKAIFFFCLSVFVCALGDVLMKFLGASYDPAFITFSRFFLSLCFLLPFAAQHLQKTDVLFFHVLRGLVLFIANLLWVKGLFYIPVTTGTILSFSVPLFTFPIAFVMLKERFTKYNVLATLLGFVGVSIAFFKGDRFPVESLYMIFSAICYAFLDVLNKKLVVKEESAFNLLFYSSLLGTFFAFPSCVFPAEIPPLRDIFTFCALGLTANLILYFMLVSFRYERVTFLAPFHYLEIVFSSLLSFMCFGDLPGTSTLVGAGFVILALQLCAFDKEDKVSEGFSCT